MKINGTPVDCDPDHPVFHELDEVIITTGSPKQLRRLGKFFMCIAKEIEDGNTSDHYHYRRNVEKRPEIVIINKDMLNG